MSRTDTLVRFDWATEGRAEAVMNVARNLKSAGMDFLFISQNTGLTIEEIEKL